MVVLNPTSRDIAEAAGVSQATVSRALRDSPLVRPETRDRIRRIARELNYFVNRNAAGLRTRHSNTIALLLFDEMGDDQSQINPFFLAMLGSIAQSAAGLGYDVLISIQQLSDDWHIQYQASNRADGIILLGYGDYLQYREKLSALADANTHFIIWGPVVDDQPGHFLGCDNESGGYQATAHLAGLGRKRIAYLGGISQRSPEPQLRYLGYQRALKETGLRQNPRLRADADTNETSGYRAARVLIDSGEEFDAIFAASDTIAIGAIQALKDADIRIPEDVAIVGFDDLPRAAYISPALTTIRQDVRSAGTLLVRNLVKLIDGEEIESTVMLPKLIIRESCGIVS